MKILLLSQHIFPIPTPRAHRTTELVKELGKQGHDVTVYAVLGKFNYTDFERSYNVKIKNIPIKFQINPYNSDGLNKRTFIDKVLGKLFGKVLEFPNIEFRFNIPQIIKREQKADLLISIADPHHIHWGCSKAKLLYPENFPQTWIADCGDPFITNVEDKSHYQYYNKFEKEFCQLCDLITVPIEDAKDGYYPEFRKKIKVLPQGFDFQLPLGLNPIPNNKIITFAYSGIFYKDIRNPELFLKYLLSIKNINFKFIIYTKYKDLITPFEKEFGNRLEIRKPINRIELIDVLKGMDFLINIENTKCTTQLPSKLIDYAIAGRPILSINNSNFNTKIIDEFFTSNYSNRYTVNNIEQYHITNVVAKLFDFLKD